MDIKWKSKFNIENNIIYIANTEVPRSCNERYCYKIGHREYRFYESILKMCNNEQPFEELIVPQQEILQILYNSIVCAIQKDEYASILWEDVLNYLHKFITDENTDITSIISQIDLQININNILIIKLKHS